MKTVQLVFFCTMAAYGTTENLNQDCQLGQLYPVEGDCSAFYKCNSDEYKLDFCSKNKIFSREQQTCVTGECISEVSSPLIEAVSSESMPQSTEADIMSTLSYEENDEVEKMVKKPQITGNAPIHTAKLETQFWFDLKLSFYIDSSQC